jgi:drug/metabolite transporter (DMT)-like permease
MLESFGCFQIFWNTGIYCICMAALCFSISSSLVRPISEAIPVFELVLVRSALSMILSLITSKAGSESISLFGEWKHMHLLSLRGLSGALAMNCFYASIQKLLLAEAMALLFLNPAIVAVLAYIFLGEKITIYGIGGCLSSLVGMVFVVQPPFLGTEWSRERKLGVMFGLFSALLAAIAYISIRKIGKREKSLTIAVWFHSTALFTSFIGLGFQIFGAQLVAPNLIDWICMLSIAPCSFLAQILISRGFQLEKAAVGAAVNYLQVFFGALFGWIFFKEPLTLLSIFGVVLIFGGVLAIAKKSDDTSSEETDDYEKQSLLDPEKSAMEMTTLTESVD